MLGSSRELLEDEVVDEGALLAAATATPLALPPTTAGAGAPVSESGEETPGFLTRLPSVLEAPAAPETPPFAVKLAKKEELLAPSSAALAGTNPPDPPPDVSSFSMLAAKLVCIPS